MSESDKIKKINAVRKLVATVIDNTKRVHTGKPANDRKEQSATETVLTELFGRKPTDQELNLATQV